MAPPRFFLLLLLAPLSGCASGPDFGGAHAESVVIEAAPVPLDMRAEDVEPEFIPLLDALQTAVREREDMVARNILARLYARQPEGRALELAEAFERILDGREYVSALRLELVTQAHRNDPTRYRVALWMLNEASQEFVFRPGPATLRLNQTVVDARGQERSNSLSRSSDQMLDVTLVPGEPVELSLIEFKPPIALGPVSPSSDVEVVGIVDPTADANGGMAPTDVLAVRYRWELDLRSGVVVAGEETFPAMRARVDPAERVWLAQTLPGELVAPAEFRTAALDRDRTATELMELAVRIAPEDCSAALELLEPELEAIGLDGFERLTPALRWIAGDSHLGGDPAVWRAWIRRRRTTREAEEANPSLQLPDSLEQATQRLRGEEVLRGEPGPAR